ncbi:MAG: hypothetical protein EA394_09990 [Bacteroidia bacterium]|nr:MAG: hypothetical protein EA394_09990 [Bacteroidia bacterium]
MGSKGNKLATGYFKNVLQQNQWETEESQLEVIDWKTAGASLQFNNQSFEVFSSPYSLGCSVEGELTAVDSISKLQQAKLPDKIVLLHGKIAAEQIMPKNSQALWKGHPGTRAITAFLYSMSGRTLPLHPNGFFKT